MPTIVGAVQNTINFSAFVREQTIRLAGVELLDEDRQHFLDPRLAALFPIRGLAPIFSRRRASVAPPGSHRDLSERLRQVPVPEPELHLGYAVRFRQNWVNMGTFLGEVQHSLALAPGESRNIATIDWKRTQVTRAGVLGAALAGGVAARSRRGSRVALSGGPSDPSNPSSAIQIGAAAGRPGAPLWIRPRGSRRRRSSPSRDGQRAAAGVSVRLRRARAILADLAQDITETTGPEKSSSMRSLWSTVFIFRHAGRE